MVLASLLALVASSPAGPEELKSKLGFFVDMPSGFTLKSGDGATRFAFTDPKGVMEYDIIAYAPGRFADASALAGQSLGKIGSSGNTTPYTYEGREAVLAELGFDQDGVGQKGYALFIQGRDGGAVKEDELRPPRLRSRASVRGLLGFHPLLSRLLFRRRGGQALSGPFKPVHPRLAS